MATDNATKQQGTAAHTDHTFLCGFMDTVPWVVLVVSLAMALSFWRLYRKHLKLELLTSFATFDLVMLSPTLSYQIYTVFGKVKSAVAPF